jgi:GT2 family glycosyltransferase
MSNIWYHPRPGTNQWVESRVLWASSGSNMIMPLTYTSLPNHHDNGEVQLAAIVSSFNRLSLLKISLPVLVQALADCPFKALVVVFDAGSSDGSFEWLQQYVTNEHRVRIDILQPDDGEDSSFSAGINTSASYCLSNCANAQWLFLFETDNWFANCDPLLKAKALLSSKPELAAAGFKVLKHSGAPAGYGCRFPNSMQFLLGQHLTHLFQLDSCVADWHNFNDEFRWSYSDVVFTSPILIKRSAWEQSRGFDSANFPFSDCDVDWCWRLHQCGLKLAVIDTDGVVHDNQDHISAWSENRALHFHKGRLQLLRRRHGAWVELLKPLLFTRHCFEFLLLSLLILLKKKSAQLLESRKALVASVFKNYSVEQKAQ